MGMNALEVRRRVMLAQPHEAEAVGAIASFRTDVISPLKMGFDLQPIQAGTGDPSPENVRPITGHDGFTRIRTGKNLFDGEVYMRAFVAQAGGKANIQGNASWRSIYARVEGGKTYTISRTTIETNRFRMVATVDEPTVGEDAVILSNSADNDSLYAVTVTIPDGYNYLFVYLSNQGATVTPGYYQIELGSHATTIVPYQGQSYTTTFPEPPGIVYGGHVIDNGDGTGTLVVTKARKVYDGGASESWVKSGSNGFYTVLSSSFDYDFTPIFNYLGAISPGGGAGLGVWQGRMNKPSGSSLILVKPDLTLYPDVPSWKNYLQSNNLVAILNLAEPQVYTLSMTAIQSLIGLNHVWVDNADSVSVEYWGH